MKNENLIHQHGGDLDAIERKYKIPKNEIMDFSGNINPLGFPESARKLLADNIDLVSTYPDKNYKALKESIALYTGTKARNVAVGNGSTELISTFIKAISPKKAIILGPAYSEYENELKKINSNYAYFALEEENDFNIELKEFLDVLTPDVNFLVLCNPNNPTGTAISTAKMEIILMHCKTNNTFVMVDETYIEFSNNLKDICSMPLTDRYDNLFVIRGIAKFFAAPGIRLGYGVTSNENFHKLLSQTQDPWSVNILAAFAGENLFKDKEFMDTTHSLIAKERDIALKEFKTWKNIKAYDSSSNFILLKLLTDKITSDEIFETLIKKKMLIRDAESFTFLDNTFLRFCILLPHQNKMLIESLKELVED